MTDAAVGRVAARQLTRAGVVALVVLVLDQVTKTWALRSLEEGVSRHVFSTLYFTLHYNYGMAFSQGTGIGRFIGLGAVILALLLVYGLRKQKSAFAVFCTALVVGGALGNIGDRLFRAEDGLLSGAVIDFIDVKFWPIFNIADSAVVVGAILLVIESWRRDRQALRSAKSAAVSNVAENAASS
jgi:signal peptidase II